MDFNTIFIKIIVLFVLVIFFVSIVSAGVDKPKKICYYTPRFIKCTDWSECVNGRWDRTCHDIRACINDGKDFRVVGRCSYNYVSREEPKTPEQIENEKEAEIREMFQESFDTDVEDEIGEDVIRLEEIIGSEQNNGYEIEGLDDTVLIEGENGVDEASNGEIGGSRSKIFIYSGIGLLVVLLILGIVYYSFFRKKDEDGKRENKVRLGNFRKEIRK